MVEVINPEMKKFSIMLRKLRQREQFRESEVVDVNNLLENIEEY